MLSDIPTAQRQEIFTCYAQYKENPEICWQKILPLCFNPRIPFSDFEALYKFVYKNYPEPHPAWFPNPNTLYQTNLGQALRDLNLSSYADFFYWARDNRLKYWDYAIKKLNIIFKIPYIDILSSSSHPNEPTWLPAAEFNIVDSCFQAEPNHFAILYLSEEGETHAMTYGELELLVNRIANRIEKDFEPGDVIAIDMPMNVESVAIYLAIIRAGCVVASIADSFSPPEISIRLKLTKAKAIFTQDYEVRGKKKITLYDKVKKAMAPKAIVLSHDHKIDLRAQDCYFADFISEKTAFRSCARKPEDFSNILFSSGTTGEPKAIPWSHTTPIKAAADAYFHHDIKPNDRISWPTNLGWMMGPWLIYAALINKATLTIFDGSPTSHSFGKFIEIAKVNILGLIPSIVSIWRMQGTMEKFNWGAIKAFSSTGECSNAEDYLYLMWLANNKPIIEYCGGTEIGGAYITGSLMQPASPSLFTTPTLGLDFLLLDENNQPTNNGAVALIPPSIGLSNQLIHGDHTKEYYQGMPTYQQVTLRRHGDQIEKIKDFCFRAHGRVDDTMNLGGIKTSSAEIERLLNTLDGVKETAAIAVSDKKGGPSKLVIYAVLYNAGAENIKVTLQNKLKTELNPLFKIHDIIIVDALPRTASNKIMRRFLREEYQPKKY